MHDLRAGLRAVRIFAELLAAATVDVPETHTLTASLLDGVNRIDTLSLGMGRYSRTLLTEERDIGVISVTAAVRLAVDEVRPLIEKTGAEVRIGELPKVRGSYSSLAAVFRELLMNALTYRSTAAPRIDITASEVEDQWRLAVADNGIGIERRDWDAVFLPFHRLQGEPYRVGLGLAICKNVVESFGGRIWLDSEPGTGCTVCLQLPKL